MTQNPDDSFPEDPNEGASGGSGEVGPKLDEDAAWRSIVEHYGDRPTLEDLPPDPPPDAPAETPQFTVFERRWKDPGETADTGDAGDTGATWDDEGHFVPPEPPPLPRLEPRRRLAWGGLFGAPLIMLVVVVFGWYLPDWLGFLLIGSFLGGFGYLVATMPRTRGEDGSGDNGAVV